jgi:hypothetical protein
MVCHEQLLFVQRYKGINIAPDAVNELKKWIYNILFRNKENGLPIFGDVVFDEAVFQKSTFGKAQIYLINEYFSKAHSHSKVIQVSLALIGYWYQIFIPLFSFQVRKNTGKILLNI